jgi:glycosyltransferase involved in cell wall biosynthesis
MNHIDMLLSNPFRPDPRVEREAKALNEANYQVRIISWDREKTFQAEQVFPKYRVERIQNAPTTYGAGARQLLHIPKFWREANKLVLASPPNAVHCHDLDTLPAGWWIKRKTGIPLVFDAHEDYPTLMSLYLPKFLVLMLRWLERRLIHQADFVIAASQVYAQKINSWGIKNVRTIGNLQSLEPFDAVTTEQIQKVRADLGLAPQDLAVAYIGGFTRNRLLLPLLEAARLLPSVKFFLWGDGHQRAMVEANVEKTSNARYLGWLPADKLPLVMQAMDVLYYCLKPDYPGAVYNASNTLSSAMAAGRPLIANEVGDLGLTVSTTNCGILLETVTPQTICTAVVALSDAQIRQKLGKAGRAAAEAKYNWEVAKGSLTSIYQSLLGA